MALGGGECSGDKIEQGRLACAVAAEQTVDAATAYLKREVVEHRTALAAVSKGEIADF